MDALCRRTWREHPLRTEVEPRRRDSTNRSLFHSAYIVDVRSANVIGVASRGVRQLSRRAKRSRSDRPQSSPSSNAPRVPFRRIGGRRPGFAEVGVVLHGPERQWLDMAAGLRRRRRVLAVSPRSQHKRSRPACGQLWQFRGVKTHRHFVARSADREAIVGRAQ